MKKSNYIKFVNVFFKRLEKQYDLRKDEITLLEILNITFLDFRYSKIVRFILFSLFLIVTTFLLAVFVEFTVTILIMLISLTLVAILYISSFYYILDYTHFNRLESRIRWIERDYTSIMDLSIKRLESLIMSANPVELVGEYLSIKAYKEFKEKYSHKEIDNGYSPKERLMIFFILLNVEFKYNVNDKEFNTILGALLNISPNRLEKEYRSYLNKLNYYIKNIPGKLTKSEVKEIREMLGKLRDEIDIKELFNGLIELSYSDSDLPGRDVLVPGRETV